MKIFLRPFLASAAIASTVLLGVPSAKADSAYWSLNGTTGDWTTTTNWAVNPDGSGGNPAAAPTTGQTATFNSSNNISAVTANLTAALGIGGIVFNNAGTTAINSDGVANRAITLGSGGITINSGAGAVTFGATPNLRRINFILGAAQTWTNNSSNLFSLNVNNTIATGGFLLSIAGTGDITAGGIISGTGGVVKNGAGTLTLSVANTFSTGGIVLNSGTLKLGNNAALGAATSVFTINGGTIDVTGGRTTTNNNAQNWNGNFAFGGSNTWDTGTGAVTMNASRIVTVTDNAMSVGGAIGGVGFSLTKEGAGNLKLNGTNTYSGGTIVNAGALSIATTGALPGWNTNGSYSVAAGAALAVQNAVVDADIATMLGTTNFAAGSRIGFDTTTADRNYNGTLTNTAQGALGLTKIGANTLFLGGSNTFTGGIFVEFGLLGGSSWGSGNVTFNGGGIDTTGGPTITNNLILNAATAGTNALSNHTALSGTISGTGLLTFNGFSNGLFTLSGNNTGWSGGITLSGAGLRLGHVNAAGTGLITFAGSPATSMQSMSSSADLSGGNGVTNNIVNNNAGTSFVLDNNLKLSGVISGNGSTRLSSNSTATLTLTGNNTYLGFTNIQAGTLSVANIGNGGDSRNIGASSNAAINLIIGGNSTGGMLLYTGAGETTDRLFTIGSASTSYDNSSVNGGAPVVTLGATVTSKIDSSGTGALVFNNTGSLLVGNALNTVFELLGSNTGSNTIAAVIGNTSAHAPIVLVNSTTNNGTNGGPNKQISVTDTTGIMVGDTVAGSGITGNVTVGAVLSSTRLSIVTGSTENHTANVTLTFTNPDVSLNKTSLLKSGAGTWVLSGANTYTGGTTVNDGTLAISGSGTLGAASGNLTVAGGILELGGSNQTVGAVSISGGTAQNGTLTGTAFNLSNNGTLGVNLAGTGALTKSGGGIVVLSGANTYSGSTTINAGAIVIDADSRLGTAPGSATAGFLNLNDAALATTADMTLASNRGIAVGGISGGQLNVATSTTLTYGGIIAGSKGLEKAGDGTLVLSGTNSYTGGTLVTSGTLVVSGTINTSSGISVNGGLFNYTNNTTGLTQGVTVGGGATFKYNSSQAFTGSLTLNAGGTLSGSGNLGATAVTIGSSQTLSPGNSPGNLATGAQTWLDGGNYNWQLYDATGPAGTGYDTTTITGALDLSGLSAGGFAINLWTLSSITPDTNGDAINFNEANQSWTLATASGGITGFDAANFTIYDVANNGTTGFSNAHPGAFSLSVAGNNLLLNYTAVPEPATWVLAALGLTVTMVFRRRRQD